MFSVFQPLKNLISAFPMAQSGNAVMDKTIQTLLDENKKLKGELNQWKVLNQNLYKFACNKMSGSDTRSDMSMFKQLTH